MAFRANYAKKRPVLLTEVTETRGIAGKSLFFLPLPPFLDSRAWPGCFFVRQVKEGGFKKNRFGAVLTLFFYLC